MRSPSHLQTGEDLPVSAQGAQAPATLCASQTADVMAPGPFTRMACQGFHLLRPMPGLPWPALDAATQANLWPTKSDIISMPARDTDVMALGIPPGWIDGPHSSSRAISCDEDSWRDLMPFTSDPGAYSPPTHICQSGICGYITHWPFLGERPWLRENECDGEDYQQRKEHLCSSVVIWHSRPLV